MLREERRLTKRIYRVTALSFVMALSASMISAGVALAQNAPIQPPNSLLQWIPPNQAPPQGQPPPPGDGANPQPVIPGNGAGPAPPVPTGVAETNPILGTNFPHQPVADRTVAYLFRNTTGPLGSRGTRADMTIRPDQLSAAELAAIQGILGVNLLSGEPEIDVVVTNAQLAEIQQVLFPYPQTQLQNGWQVVNTDTPAPGYPKPGEQSIYQYQGPLPTVRVFCRYLVILGCVVATILMAFAAFAMLNGNGGARVISTAAGFMMLLMGYTIWKVVQMDTFGAMSNTPPINQNRPNTALVNAANMPVPQLPVVPNAPGGRPARSGIPVLPLSGN